MLSPVRRASLGIFAVAVVLGGCGTSPQDVEDGLEGGAIQNAECAEATGHRTGDGELFHCTLTRNTGETFRTDVIANGGSFQVYP